MKKCVLCGSSNCVEYSAPNEKYFIFFKNKEFVCKNCGCLFSKDDDKYTFKPKKIKRKQFLEIIYRAFMDIYGEEYLTNDKKSIIENYYKELKVYYEQVANTQAAMLYDLDILNRNDDIVNTLKNAILNK